MDDRLNIAFVWHMHQPLYKDPLNGEYILPWVLLHATKDYYDMVSILKEFPQIHQTFNLVPCLIEQLKDYSTAGVSDRHRRISLKDAGELTREEKIFILKNFFNANRENMIMPLKRYMELLKKRGFSGEDFELSKAARFFSNQDLLDLQVLFNLVWIDPVVRNADPFIDGIYKKGRNFTEKEKKGLLDRQIEITAGVLPLYKEFMDSGQIEISTTPYYHTIMPVLNDSECARVAMPGAALPENRINFPEDVRVQLNSGAALYKEVFGREPTGLWPSEGSLSMEVLPLIREEGFLWAATDEQVLSKTLNRHFRRDNYGNPIDTFLYKPYHVETGAGRLSLLFRDHVISDLIGFDYARMDPEKASHDFISRLLHIHGRVERPGEHVVPVILDGENAWESYRNDGRDFLHSLYSKISSDDRLKCVTVSEYLCTEPSAEKLDWLYPGSWISHNFGIWIGHPEDNKGWDYLFDARKALSEYEETAGGGKGAAAEQVDENIKEAWKEIYTAEGSDWFWWYGDEHSSANDEQFDTLFRNHLKKVYMLIGWDTPTSLDIPIIIEDKVFSPVSVPAAYINPVIDGEVTNYFEWLGSGRIEHRFHGAAMHRDIHTDGLIEGISYGFSKDEIFFRIDYCKERVPYEQEWSFTLTFIEPSFIRVEGTVHGTVSAASIFEKSGEKDQWKAAGAIERIASERVVELALPLKDLNVKEGGGIKLFIKIDAGELGAERWPLKGMLLIEAPTEKFEEENWFV